MAVNKRSEREERAQPTPQLMRGGPECGRRGAHGRPKTFSTTPVFLGSRPSRLHTPGPSAWLA